MSSERRMPQWKVERIALGALPDRELEAARTELLEEPRGAERLAELEKDSAETLAKLPPDRVVAEVRRRASGHERPRALRWALRLPAIALVPAAAAVALVLTVRPSVPTRSDGEWGDRIKGLSPQLIVHRSSPSGPERLAPDATAAKGDLIQLSYIAAGRNYGTIVSVDGRGGVTLHLPEDGGPAGRLEASGSHALPRAFALDDAPGFERFFFVTGDSPFDSATVIDAARKLASRPNARSAPLPLPGFLTQTSFTVEKRSR